MHQTSTETFCVSPNSAGVAHKAIIRRTESSRDVERRVSAQVTAALQQEAAAPEVHFTKRIQAAHRNRELWRTLARDFVDDDNALPDDLRSKLISLAIWVAGEASGVICGDASLQGMIDVNSSTMPGLQGAAKQVA